MQRWYERRYLGWIGLSASLLLLVLSTYTLVGECFLKHPDQLGLFCGGALLAIATYVQQWVSVSAARRRLRQEVAFKMDALKQAFEHLQEFRADIRDDNESAQVNRKVSLAVRRALQLISDKMFYPETAPVSWWIPSPASKTTLRIDDACPRDGNIDMNLTMELERLPNGEYAPVDRLGVAGFSYGSGKTYYLPDIRKGRYCIVYPDGKAMKLVHHKGTIWKESDRKPQLRSLLSVAIVQPGDTPDDEGTPLGVLCVGSDAARAFSTEDIWFAWIAGRLIRELLVLARDHPTCD